MTLIITAVEFCSARDRRLREHVYVNGRLRFVYVWDPPHGWVEPIWLLARVLA